MAVVVVDAAVVAVAAVDAAVVAIAAAVGKEDPRSRWTEGRPQGPDLASRTSLMALYINGIRLNRRKRRSNHSAEFIGD